jgi:hypothetical protein
MRKPNYSMERKDRERAKQAKATAKVEKRAAKADESPRPDADTTSDAGTPGDAGRPKSDG